MDKKVTIGTVVEVDEFLHGALDKLIESNSTAQEGLWYFTQQYKITGRRMWEFLHAHYPELKRFQCSLNHITKNITVVGFLQNGDKVLRRFEEELKALDPDAEFDYKGKGD